MERMALIGGLLAVGLLIVIWTLLPAFRGAEAARRDIGTHRLAFGSLVSVLVLNGVLTLPLADMIDIERGLTTSTFLLAALTTQVPMLLVLFVRFIAPGAVTWQELGLRALPLDRLLGIGLATGIGALVMTIVIQLLLQQIGLRSNQMQQFDFVRSTDLVGFAIVFFLVAVCAPFTEELFFRGMLFGLYRRRQPLWVAYVFSGVLFALLHLVPMLMNPAQMGGLAIGIFALGSLLAFVYQRTGSLLPSIVAHGLNNATAVTVLYTFDPRSLPS
jgi:membrane protease YdiL (CAAX protease family)